MTATVILGTGIIGASTAYYLSLSEPGATIHLVEPSPTLFASASGYAGGFIAKNWFSTAASGLGSLSFAEHKRLAEEFGGKEKWGFAHSTGTSYTPASEGGPPSRRQSGRGDDWLREGTSRATVATGQVNEFESVEEGEPRWLTRVKGDDLEVISEEGTTGQVDPLRLSQFLLSQSLERGVQLHHPAKATSISKDLRDEVSSIRIVSTDSSHEVDVPCTRIIITAGAWSPQVFKTLFPQATIKLPITSLAGHSIVVKSPRWTKENEAKGCHAIFTTDEMGWSPEIISRIGEEIYVAGLNDASLPLPALATDTVIDEESIRLLKKVAQRLLGLPTGEEDLQIIRKGLCFRPVTRAGTPILARIPDEKLGAGVKTRGGGEGGVFLSAGHGPWGISMSLGTGKILAELVRGLPTSANVKGLGL